MTVDITGLDSLPEVAPIGQSDEIDGLAWCLAGGSCDFHSCTLYSWISY